MNKFVQWLKKVLAKSENGGPATCPRCKVQIDAMAHWIAWKGRIWHLACLAQDRGWRIETHEPIPPAPPAAVKGYVPHTLDARDPGWSPDSVN